MTVKVYSKQVCPYCVYAKRLLDQLGVGYQEIKVDGDEQTFIAMCQASGRRTVPQIWIGDVHVGGYDDLYALHRQGKLIPLLNQQGVPMVSPKP